MIRMGEDHCEDHCAEVKPYLGDKQFVINSVNNTAAITVHQTFFKHRHVAHVQHSDVQRMRSNQLIEFSGSSAGTRNAICLGTWFITDEPSEKRNSKPNARTSKILKPKRIN